MFVLQFLEPCKMPLQLGILHVVLQIKQFLFVLPLCFLIKHLLTLFIQFTAHEFGAMKQLSWLIQEFLNVIKSLYLWQLCLPVFIGDDPASCVLSEIIVSSGAILTERRC